MTLPLISADDHLDQAKGDYELTIGVIKEKTGLAVEEVERLLAEGEAEQQHTCAPPA